MAVFQVDIYKFHIGIKRIPKMRQAITLQDGIYNRLSISRAFSIFLVTFKFHHQIMYPSHRAIAVLPFQDNQQKNFRTPHSEFPFEFPFTYSGLSPLPRHNYHSVHSCRPTCAFNYFNFTNLKPFALPFHHLLTYPR